MATLWTFGDSFTAFYETNLIDYEKSEYGKFYQYRGGNFPKIWPQLLAEKFNMELVNPAFPGCDNHHIFHQFAENIDKIQEGDIVIVGWTLRNRFRIVDPTGQNFQFFGNADTDPLCNFWSKSTIQEILINKLGTGWVRETYAFMNLIDQMAIYKKYKVFYWSHDDLIINGESDEFRYGNPKFLLPDCKQQMFRYMMEVHGCRTIGEETNKFSKDHHFGEQGHQIHADLFYNDIIKKL